MSFKRTSKSGGIPGLEGRIERFRENLLVGLANAGEEEAKGSLDFPGPQEPSSPGEPPNSQTGLLYEGIKAELGADGMSSRVVSKRNGSTVVPFVLEGGSVDGTREARPYMAPAFRRVRKDASRIVKEAWRESE